MTVNVEGLLDEELSALFVAVRGEQVRRGALASALQTAPELVAPFLVSQGRVACLFCG